MDWKRRYADALASWIADPSEAALEQAYELGRAALEARMGAVDLVLLHRAALEQRKGADGTASLAFLAECLAPFEMLARGYREANESLHALNQSLELRIEERTADLASAEARYRSLVEQLPLTLYRLRAVDLVLDYVGPRVATLLGAPPEHWLALGGWQGRVAAEDRERFTTTRRAALVSGAMQLEYRVEALDGRMVWVRDEASLVLGPAGKPLHLQGGLVDVTREKELERQLQQAQKAESIGRLAAGVAHDFNNVLGIVMGHAELLQHQLGDTPAREPLEQILAASGRAAGITRQLLTFAREQTFSPAQVEVADLLRELETMARPVLGERIALRIEPSPDLSAVHVDAGQILQVLLNLVINGRDAMPEGGELRITATNQAVEETDGVDVSPGRYVVIAVTDTGTGMSEQVRAHLFEPFFTTKPPGRGTGLGLATSYGIVRKSGGNITVETRLGHGSTFRAWLPAEGNGVLVAPAPPPAAPVKGGGETILLVDDEAPLRRLLAQALTRNGYHVLVAGDGQEALDMAAVHEGPIALVAADLRMPRIGGARLAELLRASRPGIASLFMTGYSANVPRAPGAVLLKPFSLAEFLAHVRSAIDASETADAHEPS